MEIACHFGHLTNRHGRMMESETQTVACPWCEGQRAAPIWPGRSANGFSLVRCVDCELVYTSPQLTADQISPYYSQTYYGAGNIRFNRLFEVLVGWFRRRRADRLEKLHPQPGAVLDIGCGRGHFLRSLRQRGWNCTGTELNDTAARHARETLGLDVRVGPFDGSQFSNESYDAIYLWHVLEHLPQTHRTLQEATRMLRSGGILVIAVPNLTSWQARFSRYHWFHLDLPRHYIHCSAGWLTKMLTELGFEIVEENHFSAEQNIYGWIQSVLNCAGLKHNLLYDVLRRPSARDEGHPWRKHPFQATLSVIAACLLLPCATLAMLAESIRHRGGTVEVYARRTH